MDLARQAPASSLTDPRAELQAGKDDIAIMGKAVEELGGFLIPGREYVLSRQRSYLDRRDKRCFA
jgi:hypothetical protein